MICKIVMNQVACYKNATTLETDKKVNLIYGINGSGKSTLSDFLYNKNDSRFTYCKIEGLNNEEILVYNQQFIRDYFYEPDNLKGIFTLSKENKEAEKKVRIAEKEINKLEIEKQEKIAKRIKLESDLAIKKQNTENKTWEIKSKYTGGDRVLEYCLEGLKGHKDKLFTHILSITNPSQKPSRTTDQLKKEIELILGSNARKYDPLPKINFLSSDVESNELFNKQIIGNENSTVAELIKQLGNSDWVKQGLDYLPEIISKSGEKCPFCQQNTISLELRGMIKNFFDESYENDIKEINNLKKRYESDFNAIIDKVMYEQNPFINEKKDNFENLFNSVINGIEKNIHLMGEKVKSPSQIINLLDSTLEIQKFNDFIDKINNAIAIQNEKIDNKDTSLKNIKNEFWQLMRWDYDQTISTYNNEKVTFEQKIKAINDEILNLDKQLSTQKQIAIEEQKKTINIEEAIQNINNGLIELGIDGFKIEKYKDELYQIVRNEQCDETFKTLSEGEKMIISFLYFLELCRGKKDALSTENKKIIVIDDPISSLSHIYVFNIGRLIKNEFFGKKETKEGNTNWIYKYEQVFILTHSLYFFYEITETKHNDRKDTQKLFRLTKSDDGSSFNIMKYEEIQNDYQAYWYVIKNDNQPPALIANSMRNIIEYFFNFVEKKDLNNFFLQPSMQANRFQAFCRYINRESHSLGQNIFDFKEFNYNEFKDAFATLFKEAGYEAHYNKMIK